MRRRNIAIYSLSGMAVAALALFFMLNMTNPSDSGPAGIMVVLVLIYGFTYGFIVLMSILLRYIYRLIAPRHDETTTSGERTKRSIQRLLAVCAILAATPILVISLNSIGRMGFVDIVLIAATELLAVFYVVKKI